VTIQAVERRSLDVLPGAILAATPAVGPRERAASRVDKYRQRHRNLGLHGAGTRGSMSRMST
jgi:hypothetical protein